MQAQQPTLEYKFLFPNSASVRSAVALVFSVSGYIFRAGRISLMGFLIIIFSLKKCFTGNSLH